MERDDNRWHLDKKVPISIIVVLFVQFFSGVWYMGTLASRISQVEHDQVAQKERDAMQDKYASESAASIHEDIRELDRKLDRIIEIATINTKGK